MAVRIRLRRIGKRKQPEYRLVVADAAGPRDGRFIETIGHYNPRVDPPSLAVNEERALSWLRDGAMPTDAARSLLARSGIWEKFTGEPAPTGGTRVERVEAQDEAAGEEEEEATGAEQETEGGVVSGSSM